MVFQDRADAARQLAQRLKGLKGRNPLILAIPRGGLVLGEILARELEGELDVLLVRKLGSPYNPELAIGAMDEEGNIYLNEEIMRGLRITESQLEKERASQWRVIKERVQEYREIRPRVPIAGRIAVLTDDGIATGATMRAGITMCRAGKPDWLVVALPVGPPDSVAELKPLVDEMVCLSTPAHFMSVSQFYRDFRQVEDAEVRDILARQAALPQAGS